MGLEDSAAGEDAVEHLSVALDLRTCEELLASAAIARVAFGTEDGPRIAIVAHRWTADQVAFCAAEDSDLARWAPGHEVSVEVDLIDPVLCRGWTVSASGICQILETPENHPCRTRAADGRTIALGLGAPTLSGHWVGTPTRSL